MRSTLSSYQVGLPSRPIEAVLQSITSADLSFRGRDPTASSHNTHAFAARFPPQLPRLFIEAFTDVGDTVLDPMSGSGTTVIEAALLGRRGIGVDLDPLATLIAQAKMLPLAADRTAQAAAAVESEARERLLTLDDAAWEARLAARHPKTRAFIDYWFAPRTARELQALSEALRGAPGEMRPFLETVFSSLIVTKSGGVSRARDLAHSRPHRVAPKPYRDALRLFGERAAKASAALEAMRSAPGSGRSLAGDARALPIADESVDLIVTSPPYANAIDYVRAHKFSLVWLGREAPELTGRRRAYIGAEAKTPATDGALPPGAASAVVRLVAARDPGRARIIERYFQEMTAALSEMARVLRPGRAAIVVVGASTVRGVSVPTPFALAELAEGVGFHLVSLRDRSIDRDRRLLPVSRKSSGQGIEARMHTEQVLSLLKP